MGAKAEKTLSPKIVLQLGTTTGSLEADRSNLDGLYRWSMSTMYNWVPADDMRSTPAQGL